MNPPDNNALSERRLASSGELSERRLASSGELSERRLASSGELTHRQIITILIGLMLGMFLAALDQNIVGTAIKTIADDLNGYSVQVWVTTAYLITSTITTPIYGKLSDLYGRKPFFMLAITVFVIGSAACTFADSMYSLAAFRAVQGLGAGGLFSLALAITGDIVPPRQRAKYQGYFLAVFGTASVLGPIIGGFFAGMDSFVGIAGWRWVFLVNVPVGIVALIVVNSTLHLHHERRVARVDWGGAATLVWGLVPLLIVAEQGRVWGWTSPISLGLFALGISGLAAFIAVERRMGEDALIPLRIFASRTISVAILGGFVVGVGMFGGMILIPQYLQIVHGASPTMSGFMMLPMVLGIMIASVVSGQLMSRTGRLKIFPLIGVVLMAVGLLLLSTVSADTALWVMMTYLFLFGLGLGNTMQPLTLAVQAAVEPKDIGMATSAATFFRQIGGTVGVAAFLSILLNRLPGAMAARLQAAVPTPDFQAALKDPSILADPANQAFAQALASQSEAYFGNILNDTSVLSNLAAVFSYPFKAGFSDAMDTVFFVGAVVVAFGAIIVAFLPNIELSSTSARTQMAQELSAESVTEDLVNAAAAESAGHTLDELPDAGEALVPSREGGSDRTPDSTAPPPSRVSTEE